MRTGSRQDPFAWRWMREGRGNNRPLREIVFLQTLDRVGSADQLSLIDAGIQQVKIKPMACGLGDRLEFNVLVWVYAVALPD